jgi:hypothetical protein
VPLLLPQIDFQYIFVFLKLKGANSMKWQDVPRDPICDDDTLEALYELTPSISRANTSIPNTADATMSLSLNTKKPVVATKPASQLDKLA